jgi:hypothetical protein
VYKRYESRLARYSGLAVVDGMVINNHGMTLVTARDLVEVILLNDTLKFCDHIASMLEE